ncbi:MAG: diguanylate cyclase [Lachnospiraceae bacterium]|nr:diguanylate cyclase [Lachnospiraceae bacterium]MDE6940219.1 diguanylate cyclase [Lachnospiraceae bacterium]
MKPLKKIISRYMNLVTLILITVLTIIIVSFQVADAHRQAYEDAVTTLQQIEQVLKQNTAELAEISAAYQQTCLYNAEAIAYMIQDNPTVLDSVDELRRIAVLMEVDEIHIFDKTGLLYAGTHPDYYGYTFDSGEQMMFFKPMLTDPSLKLVQDITPNVAEAKLMQYSALWSPDRNFIVQVGMEPVSITKVTQKNELSYIFSLFRVNPDANYYAIDPASGEIVGSTDLDYVHKNIDTIGLRLDDIASHPKGFHAFVNGQDAFCVFRFIDSNYVGRILTNRVLYDWIILNTLVLLLCLVMIALVLMRAVTGYMNRFVVDDIYRINRKLHAIAAGNLDEDIDVQSSTEFSQLSSDINRMKKSLLDSSRKMSYVLSKTNMYIGVYEYDGHMPQIRFTEYVPRLLGLPPDKSKQLDFELFRESLSRLRSHPCAGDSNIFERDGRYIRVEEISENNSVFGVLIDVTEDTLKRLRIERERDYDLLTGLYNRRGLENFLDSCFCKPETFRESAFVMIDADNLKVINDTYGHECGDAYLRQLASLLADFAPGHSTAARLGGDEFVLFLYRYQTKAALSDAVSALAELQNNSRACLRDDLYVPLGFSFGCCLTADRADYHALLKEADENMYTNKKSRKSGMPSGQKS